MVLEHTLLIPTASDGLAPVQRAILRYLFAEPAPLNCAAMIKDLLDARSRPDDVDADSIDAALLAMSYPGICRAPLLDYHGGMWDAAGRLPGPVYRSVCLLPAGLDLFVAEPADCDLWSAEPLPVRYPIALLLGSASWQIEVDERVPQDKWEQRERRVRCVGVHTLAGYAGAIERTASRYRETGDLAGCLTCLGADGPPVGCCETPAAMGQDFDWGRWLRSMVVESGNMALPHGMLLGYRSAGQGHKDGDGAIELVSLPVLRYIQTGPAGAPVLIIEQPACGRFINEELDMLCMTLGAERFRTGADVDDGELPGVVVLSNGTDAGGRTGPPPSRVQLEPLADECYKAMLTPR